MDDISENGTQRPTRRPRPDWLPEFTAGDYDD